MTFMSLSSLLLIAALVVGVVLLVRHLNRSAPPAAPSGHDSAERLLAERYARGEINEQEYQQRLEILRTHPGG